jgi:hypothetical protein
MKGLRGMSAAGGNFWTDVPVPALDGMAEKATTSGGLGRQVWDAEYGA